MGRPVPGDVVDEHRRNPGADADGQVERLEAPEVFDGRDERPAVADAGLDVRPDGGAIRQPCQHRRVFGRSPPDGQPLAAVREEVHRNVVVDRLVQAEVQQEVLDVCRVPQGGQRLGADAVDQRPDPVDGRFQGVSGPRIDRDSAVAVDQTGPSAGLPVHEASTLEPELAIGRADQVVDPAEGLEDFAPGVQGDIRLAEDVQIAPGGLVVVEDVTAPDALLGGRPAHLPFLTAHQFPGGQAMPPTWRRSPRS